MTIKKTGANDIETLMQIRLEMLRVVNNLKDGDSFSDQLLECSREYFLKGEHTTVFAMDGDKIAGCASLSYINVMPTFDHPTGKRAHLMNVYTREAFRRRGVGKLMVQFLIDEAKSRGVTEISLDATQMGRPLYKSLGFGDNVDGMNLSIKK
ncbi:MAG: GNAT family N-acetyltransferase [Treponema sp.]|nr:GNAT family N-acetyltransferase [Treponema sp.]